MQLYQEFNQNFQEDEIYIELQDEMSKYKTLAHENIKWDVVFGNSLYVLQSLSLDTKILNYLSIATVNVDKAENYEIFLKAINFFLKNLKENPKTLGQSDKLLSTKKKILKTTIDFFINEYNQSNLNCKKEIAKLFQKTIGEFEILLECKFENLNLPSDPQVQISQDIKPNSQHIKKPSETYSSKANPSDINHLNDREFRDYFINLATSLLANNISNISSYAVFLEAMWGRIKSLPSHNNYITPIRYPDQNLIISLKDMAEVNVDNIKYFMQNLSLNPFWIEGLGLFCEFFQKNGFAGISKFISDQVKIFLDQNTEILKLKFQDNQDICPQETYDFFANSNKETNSLKNETKDYKNQSIDQILIDINNENKLNDVKGNLQSMISMAELFTNKNMDSNAKIMYLQIINLIETIELKDYLSDIYKKAKSFCK